MAYLAATVLAIVSIGFSSNATANQIGALDGSMLPRIETAQTTTASTTHAIGTFAVKLTPQEDTSEDKSMGRMMIEKQWHGELEGTSKGQMLTGGDVKTGSAGYVAIEKFTGALKGRKGSFILQHSATMTRGEGQLTITVVPDSGTDQLRGISGKMTIKIENGKHSYDFDYALPQSP